MAEGGLASDPKDFLMCDKHPNKKAAIYCEHHILVCCMTCAWEDHHDCKPKPCELEDVVGKFHDEQSDWVEQLRICSDSSATIIDLLKANIQLMEETESNLFDEFASIKDDVMTKLSQMEQQFMTDIEDCISNKTKNIKETLARMEQQKQGLDKAKKNIEELLQTNNPSIVAASVKSKSLIKSCDFTSEIKVRKQRLKMSKEIKSFLDCSSMGKIIDDDSSHENMTPPGVKEIKSFLDCSSMGKIIDDASSHENVTPPGVHGFDKSEEDKETMMSDFLQEDKGATPRPPKQPVLLPLAESGKIDDEEWFHGDISREVANARLLGNGDYLLRSKTNEATGATDYVLSVCSKIQHHTFIRSVKGGWKFKGRRFSTMENLIKHLHQTMTPLISASHKVVLHTPVSSRPLNAEEKLAPETIKRLTSCNVEDGYADLFDVVQKIKKENTNERVIATYDFNSTEADELSFMEGEVLEVLSKDEDENWLKAINKHGQIGLIPKAFTSKESEELSFKKGEVLEVVYKNKDAQWQKSINKHGQIGLTPIAYTTMVQAPMLTNEPEDLSDVEGNDESSAYELWTPPPSAFPEYEYSCDIKEIQWFHGCLPRENAEKRLANDGDFLVREHKQNDKVEYIVSVFWKGPRHFKYQKTLYTQPHNPVEYFVGNEVPITRTSGVMLRNPILRESWEIRNNDIEIEYEYGSNLLILVGDSLLTFLRAGHNVDAKRQIEICIDVASAIDFLQEKKCIHRNIAARSCLIGAGGNVKLADFSFCSKLDPLRSDSHVFMVPIKWTAPEVLRSYDYRNKFCLKSDIWSFGVLLWEVYSEGKPPYQRWTNRESVKHILQGQRMPAPNDAPPCMADIMTRCWNEEPNRRPNIKHILQWLKSALKSPKIENFKLPPLPPAAPTRKVPLPPHRILPPPPPGSKVATTGEENSLTKNSGPPPLPKMEDMKKRPLPPPPSSSKEGENKLAEEIERKLQHRPPPPIPTEVDEESDEDELIEPDDEE